MISAAAAGTWTLGDLVINRMGFGSMRLTQDGPAFAGDAAPSDRDRAITTLRRAVELGVNHIDTAAFYFSALRSANELINTALTPYPDDLVIVTKVGPGRDTWGNWTDAARPDQLRGQVEENLRQLGRDHLDVVNYRRQASVHSISEHFGALAELRDAGLIRHLGISGVEPAHLAEARAIAPVVCVQNAYSVSDRRPESSALLQECREHGIAFVPFFAIAGARRPGVAGGDGDAGSGGAAGPRLSDIARAHDATVAQIRLAWTLHQGPHVLAIPGTGNPDHVLENVAAGAIELNDDELASLAEVSR
ncbi:MAG TPA: aldo/keto reductase [Streptosporangiaceae bacterium]|nr:aldo/keto reductase [Streptosporangiaceae bacterium]